MISKELLILLRQQLPRNFVVLLYDRLKEKENPYSYCYIQRVMSPSHPSKNDDIYDEAILIREERLVRQALLENKILKFAKS